MTITQGAECSRHPVVADIPASIYVRRTVERLTSETARPDQDLVVWDYTHLLSIVSFLVAAGHGDAVREAADAQARCYGLPTQAEVEQEAGR